MFDINEAIEKMKKYKMLPSKPRFVMLSPKFINTMLSNETTKEKFIGMCEGNCIKEVYSVNSEGVIIAKYKIKEGKLVLI